MIRKKQTPARPAQPVGLRELAEKQVLEKQTLQPETLYALTPDQALKLVHELRVHQVELEMQNDELQRMQAQLHASQSRYQDLYDRAPVGYLALDENGLIITANLTAANLLGVESGALVGQPLTRFILSEDQDAFYLHCGQLKKCDVQFCELRLKRAGAGAFWARLDSALSRQDGRAVECWVTVTDITEQKKADAEKQRLVQDLEGKDKEIKKFLYITTHDLRSPLANIQGFSFSLARDLEALRKLLARAPLPEKIKEKTFKLITERMPESLDFIKDGSLKMGRMITALLEISRIGQLEINRETVDMNEVMKNLLVSFAYTLDKTGGSVKIEALPPCSGDPALIAHVFSNLLDNAIKYRDRGRKLEITVTGKIKDAGTVLYTVSDNGAGIKAANLGKIWDIFYRGQLKGPDAEKGEGIGLTYVNSLVSRSGGRAWAESKEGEGARFFVELPRADV